MHTLLLIAFIRKYLLFSHYYGFYSLDSLSLSMIWICISFYLITVLVLVVAFFCKGTALVVVLIHLLLLFFVSDFFGSRVNHVSYKDYFLRFPILWHIFIIWNNNYLYLNIIYQTWRKEVHFLPRKLVKLTDFCDAF